MVIKGVLFHDPLGCTQRLLHRHGESGFDQTMGDGEVLLGQLESLTRGGKLANRREGVMVVQINNGGAQTRANVENMATMGGVATTLTVPPVGSQLLSRPVAMRAGE
jgi:hypothetical protein